MANVYFEMTEAFNREGVVAVLSADQAIVWYRLAMMDKAGEWIVREDAAACRRVLAVLARHGARYRPGAPLDVDWLQGGWSSCFEFADARKYRVRCEFVSRPPRMAPGAVAALFTPNLTAELSVIDVRSLIAIKQTQRPKDYPVIGALARLLPPNEELAVTTDADRVIALAPQHGKGMSREVVQLALAGRSREDVVVALAREMDRMQQADRVRVQRHRVASAVYLDEWKKQALGSLPLDEAHDRVRALAATMLPRTVG